MSAVRQPRAEDQFAQAMRAYGLEPPDEIVADGEVHRFSVAGERAGRKSGAYRLYADGRPAGWFQNWRDGRPIIWRADMACAERPSREQWIAHRRELQRRAERRAQQLRARQAAAAQTAAELLRMATGDPHQHPYAVTKRGLIGARTRRGPCPQHGMADALLVPLFDGAGELCSLEAIAPDGTKRFLPGGCTAGAFHPLGKLRGAQTVLVGEGLATVAAACDATGRVGACAMSANNLAATARAVREMAPEARIVLLADRDDAGERCAAEAARAVGGFVAAQAAGAVKGFDMFDLWAADGPNAVRACIDAATAPVAGAPAVAGDPPTYSDIVALKPLPAELPVVDPFPLEALPDSLRPWVQDVSERMQCPPDFVAVPLLVAIASLAARVATIRLRQRDDWTEPGNLWALIVGRPGALKSPAMRAALAPLERLEVAAAAAHNAALADHGAELAAQKLRAEDSARRAKEALRRDRSAHVADLLREAGGDIPAPTRARYIVNGPTWEKLHALLAENPGGLLLERDEMRGWFLDIGREENAEARSFWIKAWSGGAFTVDRIGRGTVTATDMRVSIIGAIQPGPLTAVMQAARKAGGDNGLIERFLVAWPDDPGPWRDVDRAPDGEARRRVNEVFDRLAALTPDALQAERDMGYDGAARGLPYLRLDDGAHDAFREWRADLEQRLRAPGGEEQEAALTKFRHHVPALALALHLADGHTGGVGETAMLRALALGEYFASHARRLHGSGRRAVARAARAIVEKLAAGALTEPFSLRDVYRPAWSGLADREIVTEAVEMLVSHGWLCEQTSATEGRTALIYTRTEAARHEPLA